MFYYIKHVLYKEITQQGTARFTIYSTPEEEVYASLGCLSLKSYQNFFTCGMNSWPLLECLILNRF